MKILVTGGCGLVGTGLKEVSTRDEFSDLNITFVSRQEYDLLSREEIDSMLEAHKPDAIIHTAARVGGIGMNRRTPAQQYYENIIMNSEVINSSHKFGVKNLICFSSVCAFPGGLEFLDEKDIHKGEPFPDHRSYAYSKRMVDVQIEAYNSQYETNYSSVIPGNIFGKNDNFNLKNGHVVPSLIHRCYLAKKDKKPFEVWGTGEPMREFIYSEDIARACLLLIQREKMPQKIIVSGRHEYKIKDIVDSICTHLNYYNVEWVKDKPNGQLRRQSSKELFDRYLNNFTFTDMNEALESTVKWFVEMYPKVRK